MDPFLSDYSAIQKTRSQTGFPARLTGTYVAATGYPWEAMALRSTTAPKVVTITTPQNGKYAFTPDDNQTLASGTKGWLEPDPLGNGWIFLTGGSSFTPTISTALGGSVTINATDTTIMNCSIPSNGWWVISAYIDIGITTASGVGYVYFALTDTTNSADIISAITTGGGVSSGGLEALTAPVVGVLTVANPCYTIPWHAQLTAPFNVRMRAYRNPSTATYTTCGAAATNTFISAIQVA